MEGILRVKVGDRGVAQLVVGDEHMAGRFMENTVEALSTPSLINLMNVACVEAVKGGLPEGWVTVSTQVNVKHLAATPKGMTVTASATLVSVDGLRLTFQVEAYDEVEKVGEGFIVRFALDPIKFNESLKKRKPVRTSVAD